MDETWGYKHDTNIPSDDHLICDWEGVTGMEVDHTCTHVVGARKLIDLTPSHTCTCRCQHAQLAHALGTKPMTFYLLKG